MDKKRLSWITTVPASDINFKCNLAEADLSTCEAALKCDITKTATQAIERRIKKIQKLKGGE